MKNEKNINTVNNLAILTNVMMNSRKLIKKAIRLIPEDTTDETLKKISDDLGKISKILKEDINIVYGRVTNLITEKKKEDTKNE